MDKVKWFQTSHPEQTFWFSTVLRYLLSPSALTSTAMISLYLPRSYGAWTRGIEIHQHGNSEPTSTSQHWNNLFPHPQIYGAYTCTLQAAYCSIYVLKSQCDTFPVISSSLWRMFSPWRMKHKVSDVVTPLSKYNSIIVVKCRVILWM